MATHQAGPAQKSAKFALPVTVKQQGAVILPWLFFMLAIGLGWEPSMPILISSAAGLMLLSMGLAHMSQRGPRQQLEHLRNCLVSHGFPALHNEAKLLDTVYEYLQFRDEELVSHLGQIAEEVDSLAYDVTNSIALTNQGVTHQKTETDKLNRAMAEMLTAAESVSSNAQDASEAAIEAEDSARDSQTILQKTTESINELASQVEQSTSVIANLAKDSDSIGAILDVIKGIAEQTNLLALNAAIEAARAGEQGRGFAVVADEVRSLASRTHQSTSEIEDMIQRLQSAAQSATTTMSGGQEIAQSSVQQVTQAVSSLNAITTAVERIKIMNTQIASAAEEQSAVTQEVKNTVEAIDEVCELTVETLDSLNTTGQNMENLGSKIRQLATRR